MNTGNSKVTHHHSHTHGPVKLVDLHVQEVIGKDGTLVQDRSTTRAQFQGRFRKTSFNSSTNRPGLRPEMIEAQIEDHEREDIKIEQAAQTAELIETAADGGVILETDAPAIDVDTDLHRLADDGGPAHE